MSRSEGLFLRQILNFRRSWAETPSPGYRAPAEFPRVSVRLNVGPLGLDIGRLGNIWLSLVRIGGHYSLHAKAASEKSLPEEGVKDDTERNNDGAEAENQDIANIVSGNTRASLGCRDDSGSVCSIIWCHYGFPKRRAPVFAGAPDGA
jgi:hypothetical protein